MRRRRTACTNRLHQIGIALSNYHAASQCYPPAYLGDPTNWMLPHWSWSAFLLPYVEQRPLYESLGITLQQFGYGASFAPPFADTQIPLGVFTCPSDVGPALNQRKGFHAKSNYRAVEGNQLTLTVSYDCLSHQNGVFYLNSCTSIAAITDGSSNTLLVGDARSILKAKGT